MDMMRGILMGFGLFGLLIVGSCVWVGHSTVAVVEQAAEIAKTEQAAKANSRASRWDTPAYAEAADEYARDRSYRNESKNIGEPAMDLE